MDVPEGALVELFSDGFQVGQSKLRYDDYPAFRDQVQTLMYDLCSREALTLFGNVCGRCGNSCKRPNVVMREKDIFRIRFRLGISEQELYERYLVPAPSWNGGDSFIKLKDGRCPFLKEGEGDTIASCSLYEDRPEDCRNFVSNTAICRKEPTRLIEQVQAVRVGRDRLEVELKDGTRSVVEHKPFCELIHTQIQLVDEDVEERVERVARRTSEIIEESGPGTNTSSLRQLISDLGTIGGLDRKRPDVLEKLWSDLRELENKPCSPGQARKTRKKKRTPARIQWVQITEEAVTALYEMKFPVYLSLGQYENLRRLTQNFMQELLTLDHDELQRKLTEPDPPCFMCGECCRCYSVEINPSDIDRLVELLGGTPQEFVQKHTKPGRFSWNPGARILHKENKVLRHSAMNPRLIPVQMANDRNRFERACIFLDEREDGFFYCRVYTHRPEPCRGYETTNSLCRTTNQRAHWGRQARRLVWVRLEPQQVSAMPFDEVARGNPPQVLERDLYTELDQAALSLELEVDDILEKARRELAQI